MNAIEIINISAEIAVIIGVPVAVLIFMVGSKKQREISQLTFFADYTKRYQEIMLHLPEDLDDETVLDDENTKRYLRVYFDLCSEEFFLNKKGHINKEVWEEWKEGMQASFNKKAIYKYWLMRESKNGYDKFNEFVKKELILKKSMAEMPASN